MVRLKTLLFLTLFSLLLALPVLASPVSFTKNTFETSFWTEKPETADIDGDGKLDVLGGDFFTDQLVWWRNVNGAGTFWSKQIITGNFPGAWEIFGADMDSDGDTDVVARSFDLDEVAWFENRNGSGTSWTKHVIDEYSVGLSGLEVGDINADGYPDILMVADLFEWVVWWENDGTGTDWLPFFIVEEYIGVTDGHLLDVDGDGDLDVALAGADPNLGDISIYINEDSWGLEWTHIQVVEEVDLFSPLELDAGDMDGDGDIDLAAVGLFFLWSDLAWWENTGNGRSWATQANNIGALETYPLTIDVGDVDGDGDMDMVAAVNDGLRWFENKIYGFAWPEQTVGALDATAGAALGDINGDGDLDVIASSGLEELAWFRGDPLTPSCAPPPTGMRAWYTLDESSGVTAADRVANNNGFHVNGPTKTTGRVNGALDLDGVNEYVRVADDWRLDFGFGDFSIEGWIKTTDGNGVIASKRAQVSGKYVGYVFMVYSGQLLLQIGDTASSWSNYPASDGPSVDDGRWHHVAVRVDRDRSTGGRFYVDGVEVGTFNPTNRRGNTSNAAYLELGRTSGGGDYFRGTLDEITLYNRALSASEIGKIATSDTLGKCRMATPLNVRLSCSEIGPRIHRCTATATGGSSYSYSWSYSGNGSISPSGHQAIVEMGSCSAGGGTIRVTATDGLGTSRNASASLRCLDLCEPGQLCLQ